MKRWLGLLVAALVLAGCTGIPDSSAPMVVRTVPPAPSADQTQLAPQPADGPFTVVSNFVAAGRYTDAGHSIARQFLTKDASRRWQDSQTVVLEETKVSEEVKLSNGGATASVPMRGRRIGQLDATGLFTPTLKGMGIGDEENFTYTLTRGSDHLWRIDQLPQGVVIDSFTFEHLYQPQNLYFFNSTNSTGKILVPDLRYSALQGQALASWLLTQLLAGPRPELAQSVLNEVPDQVNAPSVQVGNPMVVELPGTSQLESGVRNDLAAQLAFTLSQVGFRNLELTDSGKPVRIPSSSGLQFDKSDFASVSLENLKQESDAASFIRAGAVIANGAPLSNLGRNLSSVALRGNPSQSLLVAGVTTADQLLIGDERRLTPVSLPARRRVSSRPEWRPFADEVWFTADNTAAGGGGIYRVTAGGPVQPVSLTSQVGTGPDASITALRFSPDGTRVALVTRSAEDTGTAWVGSLVTSGSEVQIDSLEQITPTSLAVSDLAWADSVKLSLVGAEPGAEAKVWEVYSDGSLLNPLGNSGLPGPPTSIAAALNQPLVVAVGGSIWSLPNDRSGSWTRAFDGGTSACSNPVYAS